MIGNNTKNIIFVQANCWWKNNSGGSNWALFNRMSKNKLTIERTFKNSCVSNCKSTLKRGKESSSGTAKRKQRKMNWNYYHLNIALFQISVAYFHNHLSCFVPWCSWKPAKNRKIIWTSETQQYWDNLHDIGPRGCEGNQLSKFSYRGTWPSIIGSRLYGCHVTLTQRNLSSRHFEWRIAWLTKRRNQLLI